MMMSICFSTNDKYVPHVGVTIASVLKNNPSHRFHFYVLGNEISKENKEKLLTLQGNPNCQIDFIQIDSDEFKDFYVNQKMHVTQEAYFRFKIIPLFSDLDRILYLDCDLVVLKDLKPLYEMDMANHWFAMAPDVFYAHNLDDLSDMPYCNSGVLLFNLKKCREDDVYNKLIKCDLDPSRLNFMDQDILNEVGKGHICVLPIHYNQQIHPEIKGNALRIRKQIKDTVILHYTTGTKPWGDYYPNNLQKYYFEYLKLSPWKSNYYKIKLHRLRLFLWRYERNVKNDKFKIFGVTLFKKDRKKDGSIKYMILGLPVWKKRK